MEQNANAAGFWGRNRGYVIMGIIAAAVIVYLIATRGGGSQNENADRDQQASEQQQGESMQEEDTKSAGEPGKSQIGQATTTPGRVAEVAGNVSVIGVLKNSDNPGRGNLLLETEHGKVYIQTRRDFSTFLNKEMALLAEGSLESFVFLGLVEADVTGPTPPVAEAPRPEVPSGNVLFSGRLEHSSNSDQGNYMIVSGNSQVYLQSQRDYSAWIGSNVELNAVGSLQSFSQARLKKQ